MAVVTYGRHASQPRLFLSETLAGELRGCVFNATSQHLWVYELGVWAGKQAGQANVTGRIAIYDTNASMNPTNRVGYSEAFTITNTMSHAGQGAAHTAAVGLSDDGPSQSSLPLPSGKRYLLAFLGTNGNAAQGMQEAAQIVADNEQFYSRTGISQPPPDPYGSYSAAIEGHLAIWVTADTNAPPATPSNLSPAGSINDTVPTFEADFDDPNAGDGGTDRGDYLRQYRIQVRRKSDGVSFWNPAPFTAHSNERFNKAISRAYGGTTLVRGTTYQWRCQMSDHFGTWSPWTAWTDFTPANLGFLTIVSPIAKIETNEPDFKAKWTHQSATAMDKARVRILTLGGTVLQTGDWYDLDPDIESSAAPGTEFTFAWENTGLESLPLGQTLNWQIQGDDGSQLSDWSAAAAIQINAAPSVPANLDPANSQPLTDYPLLTCTVSDPDDSAATGLTCYARIKNAGGTVLDTVEMSWNASTGRFEYQTDSDDLATFATYRWDAYSYDGTLYSGETATEGNATKSSEAIFIFAEGPTVTIDSPTEGATIDTAGFTVEWTTSDQVKYRVLLYEDGDDTAVYDSGEQVSDAGSHDIPSGYIRNGQDYDLVVWVEDDTPLEGQSAIRNISVAFTPADSVANFAATPVAITTDPWETAIRLTWDQTEYGTSVWQEYTLSRQAASGVDAERIVLARLTSPSEVSFTDYVPASGIEYTYGITQTIITGLDELVSDEVSAAATITLGGVVLCNVADPLTYRTALRYTADRDYPRQIDEVAYQPVSGAAPTTVRSRAYVPMPTFIAQIHGDAWATAQARRQEVEALDQHGGTLCYRDDKGRKLFVTMPVCSPTDHVPDWGTVAIALRREGYTEGVE